MVDAKFFNFNIFKSTMEIQDIDEPIYGMILRNVFSVLKKVYAIDINAQLSTTISATSTTSEIVIPYTTELAVHQIVRIGTDESYIQSFVLDATTGTSTVTLGTPLTTIPVISDPVTILLTVLPFDLQYAIFLHAKFIFESQKHNTSLIESTTDATGNKVAYKAKLPMSVVSTYLEYSPNAIAFTV